MTRTPPGDPDERDGGLDRRALLKAAAAPVVAGVVCVLGGSPPRAAAADRPAAEGRGSAMNSKPLMTVRILAGAPQKIGAVAHGSRIIVPVAGGDFEGPRLRGKVLPGGADWLLQRSDDVLELDLRITLQTDDHATIFMGFQGLRHGPPEVIAALGRGESVDPSAYYFRTLPRFETSAGKYAFLNRIITVGAGETRPDGAVHRIDEIL